MQKSLSFAATALAAFAIASPALAQSFSPSSGSVSGSGSIRFAQTVVSNCSLSIAASPLSATTAPIPSRNISPGDFLCVTVIPYGAWKVDVVPGSTTSIAFTLGATGSTPCYGTVTVAWNNATRTATFNNNILPPVNPGDPPCTILIGSLRIPGLQVI